MLNFRLIPLTKPLLCALFLSLGFFANPRTYAADLGATSARSLGEFLANLSPNQPTKTLFTAFVIYSAMDELVTDVTAAITGDSNYIHVSAFSVADPILRDWSKRVGLEDVYLQWAFERHELFKSSFAFSQLPFSKSLSDARISILKLAREMTSIKDMPMDSENGKEFVGAVVETLVAGKLLTPKYLSAVAVVADAAVTTLADDPAVFSAATTPQFEIKDNHSTKTGIFILSLLVRPSNALSMDYLGTLVLPTPPALPFYTLKKAHLIMDKRVSRVCRSLEAIYKPLLDEYNLDNRRQHYRRLAAEQSTIAAGGEIS